MTNLPTTMNFIDHGKGGGPEVMALAQTGLPTPAAGGSPIDSQKSN